MKIDGNQIKVGNILEINSKLWKVLKLNTLNQARVAHICR